MPSFEKPLRAESLSPRRARKRARTCTQNNRDLEDQKLPHEMSYPTPKTLQYAVTPAQESDRAFHMFHDTRSASIFH